MSAMPATSQSPSPLLESTMRCLEMAGTIEEQQTIFMELRKSPELFDALLKHIRATKWSFTKTVQSRRKGMQSDTIGIPKFSTLYEEMLTRIYKTLTMSASSVERDAALAELKNAPDALMEFMRKTVPPSGSLPVIQANPTRLKVFVPRSRLVYKARLSNYNHKLRLLEADEDREKVFDRVAKQPNMVSEFLKKNVPQLCHL